MLGSTDKLILLEAMGRLAQADAALMGVQVIVPQAFTLERVLMMSAYSRSSWRLFMPRYRFETTEDGEMQRGYWLGLPDFSTARRIGARFASEVLAEKGERVFGADIHVQATDEDGLVLFSILIVGSDAPASISR